MQSLTNFDKLNTGHLVTVLTNDVTQIQAVIMIFLRILARASVQIVRSLILAVLISPKLSLIFFVLIPALIAVLLFLIKSVPPF